MNKYELLDQAVTVMAERKGDDTNGLRAVSQAVIKHGVEHTPKILAALQNAELVAAFTKGAMREATRVVYFKFEQIRRTEEEAVRGRGVNGIEHPLDDARRGEDEGPWAEAHAAQEALEELYASLAPMYTAAAEIFLGWLNDPSRLTLPYYTSMNEDGNTWAEMMTFEDAALRITSDRIRAKEARVEKAKQALANLANLQF